jgi:hypothetical protein
MHLFHVKAMSWGEYHILGKFWHKYKHFSKINWNEPWKKRTTQINHWCRCCVKRNICLELQYSREVCCSEHTKGSFETRGQIFQHKKRTPVFANSIFFNRPFTSFLSGWRRWRGRFRIDWVRTQKTKHANFDPGTRIRSKEGVRSEQLRVMTDAQPAAFVESKRLQDEWPGYSWRSLCYSEYLGWFRRFIFFACTHALAENSFPAMTVIWMWSRYRWSFHNMRYDLLLFKENKRLLDRFNGNRAGPDIIAIKSSCYPSWSDHH